MATQLEIIPVAAAVEVWVLAVVRVEAVAMELAVEQLELDPVVEAVLTQLVREALAEDLGIEPVVPRVVVEAPVQVSAAEYSIMVETSL